MHTWVSRIENKFSNDNADKDKNYQAYHARAAIYHGGIFGVGVGKSAIKQTLPQSVSDFIYVIVIRRIRLDRCSNAFVYLYYDDLPNDENYLSSSGIRAENVCDGNYANVFCTGFG